MHTWLATGLMSRVIRSRPQFGAGGRIGCISVRPTDGSCPSKGRPRHRLRRLLRSSPRSLALQPRRPHLQFLRQKQQAKQI